MNLAGLLQGILKSRAVGLAAVVVLVAGIYFAGYMSGFAWSTIHLTAALAVAACVCVHLVNQQRAAKAAGSLEAALRAQGSSQLGGARPDQKGLLEELKQQFDESLDLLRKSKMGRGALYTIPWYVLVGPPGSGKSTLLRQSGLSFPYMTKGRSAIRGLGGTKNCDWWFADRGILLDTAGRYTTESEDREEWMQFLRLIKKGRRNRPVNGAIVAISIADLVDCSELELQAHAENVRDRIDELTRELQAVFPVYVVFTKCDRLRGFVETFDTLNKEQRRQVWGFTFPHRRPKDFAVADEFAREFDLLYRSLTVRRVELLAGDTFKKRKAQVYAFPLQFLRAKERLQSFLSMLQQANPYQEVSAIRGVYFTSGTQEGTAIDRILKVMSPADLEIDVPEESRRCYFVDDLFTRVVFADADLAEPTEKARQRRRVGQRVAAVALGVGLLGTLVADWASLSAFGDACAAVEATVVGGETELPRMRESLNQQRRLLASGNHHLERGGVLGDLRAHYEKLLQAYAGRCIDAHAQSFIAATTATLPKGDIDGEGDVAAQQAAFRTVDAADRAARIVDDGVDALNAPMPDAAAVERARALWRVAVDDGAESMEHLRELLAIRGRNVSFARARELDELQVRLSALVRRVRQSDAAKAGRLTLAQLFPQSWGRLAETTTFRQCTFVDPDQWSAAALALTPRGPLFSSFSVALDALHLERFLREFEREVDQARGLVGEVSQQPLAAPGDDAWNGVVAARRDELLRELGTRFDAGWREFLGEIRKLADEGRDAPDRGDDAVARLRAVPRIAQAWFAAKKVLDARRDLTEAERKELDGEREKLEQLQKLPEKDWAAPGKIRPEAKLEDVTARSSAAAEFRGPERQRAKGVRWPTMGFDQELIALECSLIESICQREWRACREEIARWAAPALLRPWSAMHERYPFQPNAAGEADAAMIRTALEGMDRLRKTLAGIQPKEAFELDPTFAERMRAAEELQRVFYGDRPVDGPPGFVVNVRLQKEGAIKGARLSTEAQGLNDAGRIDWRIGAVESVQLRVTLTDGTQLQLRDVRPDGAPLPEGAMAPNGAALAQGIWGLKRLVSLGKVEPDAADPRVVVSSLGLSQRTDRIVLVVQAATAELAKVFAPDWPGKRYELPATLWRRP